MAIKFNETILDMSLAILKILTQIAAVVRGGRSVVSAGQFEPHPSLSQAAIRTTAKRCATDNFIGFRQLCQHKSALTHV
jgi:hypothetical protein